jgi:hypothetical protein
MAEIAAIIRFENDSGASLGWRASIQRARNPAPTTNADMVKPATDANIALTTPVDSSLQRWLTTELHQATRTSFEGIGPGERKEQRPQASQLVWVSA